MVWRFLVGCTQSKGTQNKLSLNMTWDHMQKGSLAFTAKLPAWDKRSSVKWARRVCWRIRWQMRNWLMSVRCTHLRQGPSWGVSGYHVLLHLTLVLQYNDWLVESHVGLHKWEDRQMLRLVSYLNSTCEYVMRAAVEPDQAPTLLVYTDSDCASCPYTSRSQPFCCCICSSNWFITFPPTMVPEETKFDLEEYHRSWAHSMGKRIIRRSTQSSYNDWIFNWGSCSCFLSTGYIIRLPSQLSNLDTMQSFVTLTGP